MARRKHQPPKSAFKSLPTSQEERALLEALAAKVFYEGHPHHKANPLDYELTPPAAPRANKNLCDKAGLIRRAEAQRKLERGIREGLVSSEWNGDGFPQRVWSVDDSGLVFESKHSEKGRYHGFPLDHTDAFTKSVLKHRASKVPNDEGVA
jgi:hypothetical protein